MSLRYLHTVFVLIAVLVFTSSGCSLPPWRKSHLASQQKQDDYGQEVATRIQYDTSLGESGKYRSQPTTESTYNPVAPVRSTGASGSCCH